MAFGKKEKHRAWMNTVYVLPSLPPRQVINGVCLLSYADEQLQQ